MALQGVEVEVHDIDIQADKAGVYKIANIFSEYVVEPVYYRASERIRSHFGMLDIDGVKIDIMGDVQKLLENQTWEDPIDVVKHRHWLNFDDLRVPVLSLEYEVDAYLKMGRIEKAHMLKNWLEKRHARGNADV